MNTRFPGRRLATGVLAVAAVATGTAAATAATSTTHLDHSPVVTFDRKHPGKSLDAYVRYTKELARTSRGAPLLRLAVSGPTATTVESAGTAGRRSRACYTARLFGGPKHPKTGMAVKLVIETGPRSSPRQRTVAVHLRGVNNAGVSPKDNPVLQDMGCVGSQH